MPYPTGELPHLCEDAEYMLSAGLTALLKGNEDGYSGAAEAFGAASKNLADAYDKANELTNIHPVTELEFHIQRNRILCGMGLAGLQAATCTPDERLQLVAAQSALAHAHQTTAPYASGDSCPYFGSAYMSFEQSLRGIQEIHGLTVGLRGLAALVRQVHFGTITDPSHKYELFQIHVATSCLQNAAPETKRADTRTLEAQAIVADIKGMADALATEPFDPSEWRGLLALYGPDERPGDARRIVRQILCGLVEQRAELNTDS